MNMIETIAVVFSFLSVILTIRNNIWCWPVGIIGVVFYMVLFEQNQIWGNMSLQVLFIIQSILGWYNWNKPSKYPIKWLSEGNRSSLFAMSVLFFLLMSIALENYGDKMPYFDASTTSLSIIGMVLLSYRKIESWIFWIIADAIFVWFFYINELYLSSIIYLIFLILAISGLLQWRKSIKVG
jgi:nicotinamide mononucleotide transporter